MKTLNSAFSEALEKWNPSKREVFAKHPLGELFRHEIPNLIQSKSNLNPEKYLIQGSIGQGQWCEVPWVCIFDKEITKSAEHGYYCVYLLNADSRGFYLSLGIGWTQFQEKYARQAGGQILKSVRTCRQLLTDEIGNWNISPIKLDAKLALGRGYELGHICSKYYDKNKIPDDQILITDLNHLLIAYDELKRSLGRQNILGNLEDFQKKTLIEDIAKDATFQRDIEIVNEISLPKGPIPRPSPNRTKGELRWLRNPGVAKRVIKDKKFACEVSADHVTFISQATKQPYIEAHHLVPIGYQDEFEKNLDVPENILVLCPLCHRQFHHAESKRRNMLIELFYDKRKQGLQERGIGITLNELKEYY